MCVIDRMPRFASFEPMSRKKVEKILLWIVPLIVFVFAFTSAFHLILLQRPPFKDIPMATVRTFTLILGDYDYDNNFVEVDYPYLTTFILLVLLVFSAGVILNIMKGSKAVDETNRKDCKYLRNVSRLRLHILIDTCFPHFRKKYNM